MTTHNTQNEIDILRARHVFENEQMHKRLTWIAQFESILFAALGVAWNASRQGWLIEIISGLGLAISLQGIVALFGVGRSLIYVQSAWFAKGLHKKDDLGLFGIYDGKRVADWRVMPLPELFIPFACAIAWVAVIFTKHLH